MIKFQEFRIQYRCINYVTTKEPLKIWKSLHEMSYYLYNYISVTHYKSVDGYNTK